MSTLTRKESTAWENALEDGRLIDLTSAGRELGCQVPLAITRDAAGQTGILKRVDCAEMFFVSLIKALREQAKFDREKGRYELETSLGDAVTFEFVTWDESLDRTVRLRYHMQTFDGYHLPPATIMLESETWPLEMDEGLPLA